jgi:nucleotide-binding universal stress UspA family protein
MRIPSRKVLVAVDFGEVSDLALEAATEIAVRDQAELVLVHVWEIPAYAYGTADYDPAALLAPIHRAAQARLDELVVQTRRGAPAATGLLKSGTPSREILTAIEECRPDLVVMGTHGRRGVRRAVFGSVAEKVVRESLVPALTMRTRASA